MGLIKFLILVAALTILPFKASAQEGMVLRAGADFTHYKSSSIYSVGWEDFDYSGLGYKLDGGFWTEQGDSRRGSPYASALVGTLLGNPDGINLNPMVGVAIIGYTDTALSLPFEFTEEAAIGYKNVAIGYKHFSNAGLKEPNQGRDYIFVNWRF